MEKEVTVSLNEKIYQQIQDIVGYCKVSGLVISKELPINEEEVINSALHYYLRRLENMASYLKVETRALNLKSGTKIKNNLKHIATMKKLKQREIADLTGIDQATLSTIFNNHNQPSIEYFLRLWTVLGCPDIEDCFYRET